MSGRSEPKATTASATGNASSDDDPPSNGAWSGPNGWTQAEA
jgi:hypothetical protein